MTLPTLAALPLDNTLTTLAGTYTHGVSTTVVLAAGAGTRFGTPSAAVPVRFALIKQSQLSGGIVSISDPTKMGIFHATGISGDTLTGVSFESGTNEDFVAGDFAAGVVCGRDITDLQTYLQTAGPINILAFGTVVGDGATDDQPAIQAIVNAYPGRTIYGPRTITPAAFSASGGLAASYFMGNTLTLPDGTGLVGDGGVNSAWTFKFAAGKAGIRMGNGCVVGNLAIRGSEPWNGIWYWQGVIPAARFPGVTVGSGASAADGIQVAGLDCRVSNVNVSFFGRDGINLSAGDLGVGGAEDAILDGPINANNNRGHGIYIQGGDSNCVLVSGADVNVNQFWGINSDAFLAATIIAPQADQNGFDDSWGRFLGDPYTAVASLVRSGNVVTLTWVSPYTVAAVNPGDGVWITACTDASFLGRWRIATVAGDHSSLTYTQVAANATVTGGTTAIISFIPPDFTIASAVRASDVVTLTATVPVVIPYSSGAAGDGVVGRGFLVGQGVTLVNCPDATFNGTFVVLSVSTDLKTVTYAQTASNATITSGTVRMAIPYDTWQNTCIPLGGTVAEPIQGGSYRASVLTNNQVWVQPYAEGGQTIALGNSSLILAPTWSDPIRNSPGYGYGWMLQASGSGSGQPATNKPIGLYSPYDLDAGTTEVVGLTANFNVVTNILDVTRNISGNLVKAWRYIHGVVGWFLYRGDNETGPSPIRLSVEFDFGTGNGNSRINSDGTSSVLINVDGGTGTGGAIFGDGTGGSNTTTILGAGITLVPIHDSAALVGQIYLSLDQLDGPSHPKLCRKTPSGTVVIG